MKQLLNAVTKTIGIYNNFTRTICCTNYIPIKKKIIQIPKGALYSTKKLKMELEHFDYVVTYPKNLTQIDTKEKIVATTPVVLLFGWANSKDKHLAKYSKIYEEKGMITIRYCIPNQYFFWEPSKAPVVSRKIASLVCELNLDRHPIIVHTFSNGGSIVYLNISKALETTPKPLNIKGVIFDSAPGNRRLIGYFWVLSDLYREQILQKPIAFLITVGVSIFMACENIYNLVDKKGIEKYLDVTKYLNSEKYRWPQHCIYSKKDQIVYAPDVDEFIARRKKLGIEVTSLCFQDSPHVSHYMYHKEEYTKSVLEFIDNCLKMQQNQKTIHSIYNNSSSKEKEVKPITTSKL